MKSFVFCLWVETGLAELLCIFSGLCAFGCHMGERKQPHKYLSKVYICTGIFRALLHFGGKTITRQTECYHYKRLCKVHISNGNFNLGMNVQKSCLSKSEAPISLGRMLVYDYMRVKQNINQYNNNNKIK